MSTNPTETTQPTSTACVHSWTVDYATNERHYCDRTGEHNEHHCPCGATAPAFAVEDVEALPSDERGDIIEDVERVELPAPVIETADSRAVRARLAVALQRVLAVIALLVGSDIEALREDERERWQRVLDGIEARRAVIEEYSAVLGEQSSWRASDAEQYASSSENDLGELAELVEQAQRRARATMPTGTMYERGSEEWTSAAQRGCAFASTARWSLSSALDRHPAVSVADLLCYWQQRAGAYVQDVDTVNRTLRAQDRAHRYDVHEDVLNELHEQDELHSNRWHAPNETRRELALGDIEDEHNEARASRTDNAPNELRDLHDACTVLDVLASIHRIEDEHAHDIERVASALYYEATEGRGSSWCNEYESTVRRLNAELSTFMQSPFTERVRCYVVDGSATLTLRIPISWSTRVEAQDERDALRQADSYDADIDVEEELAQALGIDYSTARRLLGSYSHDVDDYETDSAYLDD